MLNVMLRRASLLWALILLFACGGSPTAPSLPATPPPPSFPGMTGGWGGTSSDSWTVTGGGYSARNGQTCNDTWIIGGQNFGSFTGTYQRSPGTSRACADAGTVQGTILPSGDVLAQIQSYTNSGCVLLAGESRYGGIVSVAGGLTAQHDYAMRCPDQLFGTLEWRVSGTISLNRR
jgi:hypothetical protein